MGLIEQLPKATFGPRSEDECVDAEESGGGTIVFDSEGVMKSEGETVQSIRHRAKVGYVEFVELVRRPHVC
jgi:hypothetical protein